MSARFLKWISFQLQSFFAFGASGVLYLNHKIKNKILNLVRAALVARASLRGAVFVSAVGAFVTGCTLETEIQRLNPTASLPVLTASDRLIAEAAACNSLKWRSLSHGTKMWW